VIMEQSRRSSEKENFALQQAKKHCYWRKPRLLRLQKLLREKIICFSWWMNLVWTWRVRFLTDFFQLLFFSLFLVLSTDASTG
jgi:hypothetical protein